MSVHQVSVMRLCVLGVLCAGPVVGVAWLLPWAMRAGA